MAALQKAAAAGYRDAKHMQEDHLRMVKKDRQY